MTGACHTFRPVPLDDVAAGQDVRLRVTGAFADTLGPILMQDDARVVEGTVVEDNGSGVMLEIPVTMGQAGVGSQTLSQRINIPSGALVDAEVKELSKPRTAAAVAILAGAATAIVISQFSGDSGGAPLPGPGGPLDDQVAPPFTTVSWSTIRALFGF